MRAKRNGVSIATGIACAAILAWLGCANLGIGFVTPEVQIANVVPLESTAFEQRMQVDVRIRNPNRRAIEIEGLRFAFDLNGRRLGTGQSGEFVEIPGLGEAVVPVTVTTTLLDLVGQLFAMQERSDFGYEVYGDLFLTGVVRPLSFSQQGQLGNVGGAADVGTR